METILDMQERTFEEQTARLAFQVWRLKFVMKTKDRHGQEIEKMKSRPLIFSASSPIDGVRSVNGNIGF